MLKSLAASITGGFKKNPIIIYTIIGIIMILVGFFIQRDQNGIDWGKLLVTVGGVLLSGGVFAVIVKSAQFSEIFEKTLRNIIYAKEHLDVREDLDSIWESVTLALSKQKFGAISVRMHQNIKKYFLPVNHDFYYNDPKITLDIEIDPNDSEYIILTEKQVVNLVTEDECLEIYYKFTNGIPFDLNEPAKTSYKLESFKLNGKVIDVTKNLKVLTDKNTLLINFELMLTGNTKYNIVREEKKKYKLELNMNKRQLASWIYNNCTLNVTYVKDINIEFNDFGVLGTWKHEIDTHNKKYNKLEAEYKGLIYKNQGFLLHLNKN
jgi:hypothetical protein